MQYEARAPKEHGAAGMSLCCPLCDCQKYTLYDQSMSGFPMTHVMNFEVAMNRCCLNACFPLCNYAFILLGGSGYTNDVYWLETNGRCIIEKRSFWGSTIEVLDGVTHAHMEYREGRKKHKIMLKHRGGNHQLTGSHDEHNKDSKHAMKDAINKFLHVDDNGKKLPGAPVREEVPAAAEPGVPTQKTMDPAAMGVGVGVPPAAAPPPSAAWGVPVAPIAPAADAKPGAPPAGLNSTWFSTAFTEGITRFRAATDTPQCILALDALENLIRAAPKEELTHMTHEQLLGVGASKRLALGPSWTTEVARKYGEVLSLHGTP